MYRQWIADNWYRQTSISLPWALNLCYGLGDTAFWQHNSVWDNISRDRDQLIFQVWWVWSQYCNNRSFLMNPLDSLNCIRDLTLQIHKVYMKVRLEN